MLMAIGALALSKTTNYTPGSVFCGAGVAVLLCAALISKRGDRFQTGWRIGGIGMLSFCMGGVFGPAFVSSRVANSMATCRLNLKQLCTAVQIYLNDSDDHFPPAGKWFTAAQRYGPSNLTCPNASSPYSYAMNDALSSFSSLNIAEPNHTILLFEMNTQGPNAHGSEQDVDNRHGKGSFYGLTDASAKFGRSAKESKLRWKP